MDGKLTNGVSLLARESGGCMSIQEAKMEAQKRVDTARRKLLKLVLREGAIPRPCKQLLWKMCKESSLALLFPYLTVRNQDIIPPFLNR